MKYLIATWLIISALVITHFESYNTVEYSIVENYTIGSYYAFQPGGPMQIIIGDDIYETVGETQWTIWMDNPIIKINTQKNIFGFTRDIAVLY